MLFYLSSKAVIFYLLFNCVLSKKQSVPHLDGQDPAKLNECKKCKVLTDSFAHWMKKTSRGKHEGGDAAWEEAKLKSYSRSEMRLVEIQEGLCSELSRNKDQCYALAEEAEQPLEDWWFKADVNFLDLHTWLCIDTLQHCCPSNHFGESCKPCYVDKNNKVCGGNGKCNGEGTRKGDGSCKCDKGYSGKYCEECAKNYFSKDGSKCSKCHKTCEGCKGEGPEECQKCREGWILNSGKCVDIDECAEEDTCGVNEYCINREGSHICKPCDESCNTCSGAGPENCTSCTSKYIMWNKMCISEKQKEEFISSALKRAALYFGLLMICFFISRTSKSLASIIILVIALYIYYSEKISTLKTFDIIYHTYF